MKLHAHHRYELLVYGLLWTVMFIAPIISIEFHHQSSDEYPWHELLGVWLQIANLFLVFLIHNFFLAPLLVYRQRRLLYFSCIAVLAGCFVTLQCIHRPTPHFRKGHPTEMIHQPEADDWSDHQPPHHEPRFEKRPPLIFGQHDLIATLMLVMMLGMNIGVKLYFKQRDDQQRMHELEKDNLHQQLEYLRYQINPHFLMNTLNNIHALVDIDGEKAKETIVELSKLMRFALYEGARQTVPLSRDIAFLQSYVKLMRLRYTEKVCIEVNIPSQLPDIEIPPMLFITFVENAFKHGISYQQESFIDIRFTVQPDSLLFNCKNSKPQTSPKKDNSEGGVGLQNVQKRLQLIYSNRYQLTIDDENTTYEVSLLIPFQQV